MSLLHCRSEVVREEFDFLLHEPATRHKFVNEITLTRKEGENTAADILLALWAVKKEDRLGLVTGVITTHYSRVFRKFSAVILKPKGNMSWLTTDLPVLVDKQGNYNWLICWGSEVYFPLSPEYCLFLFNKDSTLTSNPLRNARPNKIHLLDDEQVHAINMKLL